MLNAGLFLCWFIHKRCLGKANKLTYVLFYFFFFFLPSSFSVPLAGILEREVQNGETACVEGWLLGPISFCIMLFLKGSTEFLHSNEFELSV